jgi:hypothetical protein
MVDLLLVGFDLLHQRASCSTSTSINRLLVRVVTGSACNWGLAHLGVNPGGSALGLRIALLAQEEGKLLYRSLSGGFQSGVSLEESQGGRLVQLGKQRQGHRIVRLQAGGELVNQPGLALDQGFQSRLRALLSLEQRVKQD